MKPITSLILSAIVAVSFIGCQTTKKECPMKSKCPTTSKTCPASKKACCAH